MINLSLKLPLTYDTDHDYRECICDVFNVPEDADDFNFDECFSYIHKETANNAFFIDAFKTAAGFMISEDLLTGVCILCAYDYLALFYAAFVDFMEKNKPVDFSEVNSMAAAALFAKIKR